MVAIKNPETRLNDPTVMFIQDIVEMVEPIPELERKDKSPILEIFLRGTTKGTPDIVTERTEAYIRGWDDVEPDDE